MRGRRKEIPRTKASADLGRGR